jgi:hypothetical protein
MPRSGSGVFGAAKPVLEIKYGNLASAPVSPSILTAARPQSPFVVFYGDPSESQSAELVGKLVLNNPEPMSVRSIKLSLTGMRKISCARTVSSVCEQELT